MEKYESALLRHYFARKNGEVIDPESGLDHYAALAWNALTLLEFAIEDELNRDPDFILCKPEDEAKVRAVIKGEIEDKPGSIQWGKTNFEVDAKTGKRRSIQEQARMRAEVRDEIEHQYETQLANDAYDQTIRDLECEKLEED